MYEDCQVAIDLFSGAGGLAEGLELAGIHVAAAVELHPQPALTHAFNHPETAVLAGDIRKLSFDLLAERAVQKSGKRTVDLVVGGPPCQGFSTAGKKSADDPRNNLFRQFERTVAYFRPRAFLLENVPGFAEMHGGRAILEASKLFEKLGYRLRHSVVNAAHYGVPQRRQRFVMVGWFPDVCQDFDWPDATHANSESQKLLPAFDCMTAGFVSVQDALEDIAFLEPGWEAHKHNRRPSSEFQRERRDDCTLLFNHLATKHRERAIHMFSFIPEGGTISQVPKDIRSGKRTMARWDRHSVSNAVLALPDDLIHYCHARIPTAREMARLQTFDDDYVFIGKRTSGFVERRVDVPQYTQIGNAVPPLLGKALGRSLLQCLGTVGHDRRNLAERRSRHAWIRGSSGFAGYTLDEAANNTLILENVFGERLPLPISQEDKPVFQLPAVVEWVKRSPPRRGQWAPGVSPRNAPAYVEER